MSKVPTKMEMYVCVWGGAGGGICGRERDGLGRNLSWREEEFSQDNL